MEMVREIAVICPPGMWDPASFAFAVEAARIQLREHFLPAWGDYLPNKGPLEVVAYADSTNLAPTSFYPIEIVRQIDGALGDHGGIALLDSAWGRSRPESTVLTHEILELAGDRFGDRWVRLPSGLVVALEVGDPVENDYYAITATIGGATRDVWVSNFVQPAWFGEGVGQLDHMGLCKFPGDNRGYMIVQEPDGSTINVFASHAGQDYQARVCAKVCEPRSRTAYRHDPRNPKIVITPGNGPKGWEP